MVVVPYTATIQPLAPDCPIQPLASDCPIQPLPPDCPIQPLPPDCPIQPLPPDCPIQPLPSDCPIQPLPSDCPIQPLPSDWLRNLKTKFAANYIRSCYTYTEMFVSIWIFLNFFFYFVLTWATFPLRWNYKQHLRISLLWNIIVLSCVIRTHRRQIEILTKSRHEYFHRHVYR
jgi:hypothetical protein